MARIAGVDLPREKRIEVALQYIYGIGKTTAQAICHRANVEVTTRTKDLTERTLSGCRSKLRRR